VTERRKLEVPADAAGQRVDVWLAAALGLPRTQVKALLERRAVQIGGRTPRKGDRTVAGAQVEVLLSPVDPHPVPQAELPLSILHADEAVVAVDKPSGWPSHPLQPGERGTVANALVARFPECAEASEDAREGGLVHRLDTETSGVLLAARTRSAWEMLRRAFSEQKVDKRYLAVVTGPIAEAGEVELPLRHRADHVEPALDGSGRPARSEFRVLSHAGDASLIEVRIDTGVLHQIRAHLAAIGAPVLGDGLYGGRSHPGLERFFLHASRLAFVHPLTNTLVTVQASLPQLLRSACEELGLAVGDQQ
jgi:23S rRNA pseudouridine1911/1915/1917 synthase